MNPDVHYSLQYIYIYMYNVPIYVYTCFSSFICVIAQVKNFKATKKLHIILTLYALTGRIRPVLPKFQI